MTQYLNLIDDSNREQVMNLYHFLEENCSDSKGSSHNHQSWPGGYFDHLNEIMKYAISLYDVLSRDRVLDFTLSDAILVLFLHDLEKPIKYSKTSLKIPIHVNQLSGNLDIEIKNYLIEKFNFSLTSEHLNALKYIHGEGDDYRKDERVMNPLGAFCHCCDIISARIFFDYPKRDL